MLDWFADVRGTREEHAGGEVLGGCGMLFACPPLLSLSTSGSQCITFFPQADSSLSGRECGTSGLTAYGTRGPQWPCSPTITRKVRERPHWPNIQNQVTIGEYLPRKKLLGSQTSLSNTILKPECAWPKASQMSQPGYGPKLCTKLETEVLSLNSARGLMDK